MKFKLEVAELVRKQGHVHLHLVIGAEDGWREEKYFFLDETIHYGAETRQEQRTRYTDQLARFVEIMIDGHIRDVEWEENPPRPVRPRILAALLDSGYDVE